MKRLGLLLGVGAGVAAGIRFMRRRGSSQSNAEKLEGVKSQAQRMADTVKGRLSGARREQEIDLTSTSPYATEPAMGAPTTPPIT